ncbi:MAG TPA: 16S rRNA (cytidine(1402)-2'-O)-methyltransferase [Actinomycetota bacterium]|jgi:16S rRNA (cytidine1402-2'-O)-methyltransferase|nr:16S rRNA (cytidine(1402)-2'-O)-methyltransferase [Actinomycetota bacterium]
MAGTLWLVGTPIGNLGDVTERARITLARADLIACEDTRRTRKLLSHLGIHGVRLVTFFEGNERKRIPELLDRLRGGRDVAVVSDAGMPGLSDPGERLVRAAVSEGIPVDVVPGPSAAITALVLSGLPAARFAFEGFFPRKQAERRTRLQQLAGDPRTIVAFESPRRLGAFLADAAEVLGDRRAAVVRELTKVHQDVVRAGLSDLAARYGDEEARGEVVLVIEGRPAHIGRDELEALAERVEALTAEGMARRQAAALVAEETGASRRALYEASLRRRG